jgi:tetratricopeptide (TPR) repeat protein
LWITFIFLCFWPYAFRKSAKVQDGAQALGTDLVFWLRVWYKNPMKLLHITNAGVCATFFALVILATSCVTQAAVIPEDLSAAEMVQRAQEASDRNRYSISLQYYEAILERFPNNAEYTSAAQYEIAFIYYKQRKYDQSRAAFNALLDRYNSPEGPLLPPQYKILALKVLETIAERETGKKR